MDTKQDEKTTSNLTKVLQLYSQGGFHVQTILMDMEFDKIKDLIPMINVNISAANEHVAEVEQRIRTIKERCRGIMGTLPFTYIPQQLIMGLVQFVTMWLNAFPCKTGISRKWSPREIICRHQNSIWSIVRGS